MRAMLAEVLEVVATLDVVKAAGVATVVSGVNATLSVELHSEGIATAFGKDLVAVLFRVVTPQVLAHRVDRRGSR